MLHQWRCPYFGSPAKGLDCMYTYWVGVAKLFVERTIVSVLLGMDYCPSGVAGCIKVYGETIGTFRIVRYIVGVRR